MHAHHGLMQVVVGRFGWFDHELRFMIGASWRRQLTGILGAGEVAFAGHVTE